MRVALVVVATFAVILVGSWANAQDQSDAAQVQAVAPDILEFNTVHAERVLIDQAGLNPNRAGLYDCGCYRPCMLRHHIIRDLCLLRGSPVCNATCISEIKIENMRVTHARNLMYIPPEWEPLPIHNSLEAATHINCSVTPNEQSYKKTSEKKLSVETVSRTSLSNVRSWSASFQVSSIVPEGIGWEGSINTSNSITIGSQAEEKNFDHSILGEETTGKIIVRPYTKKTITYIETVKEANVDVQADLVIDGDVVEYSVLYDTQRNSSTGIEEGAGHPIGRLSSLVPDESRRSIALNARVRVTGTETSSERSIHEKKLTEDSEECRPSG